MKFNILIECLEPECSVINFHWRPALHYHVSQPNYICINDVRHYYHGLGRTLEGWKKEPCSVKGQGRAERTWHQWSFFFFSSADPLKCWGYMSLQCGESESGRFPSKWGFQETSIGNIKSQSLNNHWREWLNGNSSTQTEQSLLISLWPIVWDQWKIN